METLVILGIGIGAVLIGCGVLTYIKVLKKRMRKYVLRYEKVKKYFQEDKK